jgi:hypothetical protein
VVQDHLTLEDDGSTILWTLGNYLPDDTVPHPRMLLSKQCRKNIESYIRSFAQILWEDCKTGTIHIRQYAAMVVHLKTNTRKVNKFWAYTLIVAMKMCLICEPS